MRSRGWASRVRWTKGLLVPERVQLRATAGAAGAQAARVLYRQYRHPGVARVAAKARTLAFATGLAPPSRPPLDDLDDLCDLLGVAPHGAAAIHSWMIDRQVICLVSPGGCFVVKVGHRDDEGLANEARLLQLLAGNAGIVEVPSVRWSGFWSGRLVVATEVLPLARGWREVTIDDALTVVTQLAGGLGAVGPLVHGDLSPWNLLRLRDGLGLVDWEYARLVRDPFFDLTHFVVTTSSLLNRNSPEEALALLTAPHAPGWTHLVTLGLDPRDAYSLVEGYLLRTSDHSDWAFRSAMLAALHRDHVGPRPPADTSDAPSAGWDQSVARRR